MKPEDFRERIWIIADGFPLNLGNMTIKIDSAGKLLVTGWTSTAHFSNITKQKISEELEELKESFSELSKTYKELTDIVELNNLTIEYHMAYDDNGKGGIGLCSEINGILNWYI